MSGKPLRIAIADDSRLAFSDDYREGWPWGFRGMGCEVKVFDIGILRGAATMAAGADRSVYSMGRGLYHKDLARQIIAWNPDLVFAHHGRAASHEGFNQYLKGHGIRTACYLCDEPYEVGETAGYSPRFDFVFTMDPCTITAHRRSRPTRDNVFYLPPGVHTGHFSQQPYADRKIRAFFLGNASLIPRLSWLAPVQKLVDGADIRYPKGSNKIKKEWIPYSDHPKWYGNTLVGLNVHRSPVITRECFIRRIKNRHPNFPVPSGIKLCPQMPAKEGTGFWNDANLPAAHVNPRFLEMAACGTLVVSDAHRPELRRLFPCAPQAEDPDHFLELVLYYLEHPDEAEEIGRLCSYLISKRHSYKHRAAEVLIHAGLKESVHEGLLSSLGAPEDWLSPQDFTPQGIRSSSEPTGLSERWSPASGLLWTKTFGNPSAASSIDAPPPWLL